MHFFPRPIVETRDSHVSTWGGDPHVSTTGIARPRITPAKKFKKSAKNLSQNPTSPSKHI
jgi:hypothetical protein